MELMTAIEGRRSVRSYLDKTVERGVIESLLQAAVRAPNAMNSQPWAFGVIQGAEALRHLSDQAKATMLAQIDQAPAIASLRGALENPSYNIFYGAPTLVVIYARPGISPTPEIDCTLAAENLMLAAHSAGLGTCWIGLANPLLDSTPGKEAMGVPADYRAIAPIIVGYPDGEGQATPRRTPEIAFWR